MYGSDDKESPCIEGDLGSIPGLGRSPGEGTGYPLQYSGLENPMDRGAWWATVHGVTKSQTRQSDWHFHFLRIYIKYMLFSRFSSLISYPSLFFNNVQYLNFPPDPEAGTSWPEAHSWTHKQADFSGLCPLRGLMWDPGEEAHERHLMQERALWSMM